MKLRLVLLFFWLVILLLSIVCQLWFLVCIAFNPQRGARIAMGYDQMANACLGNSEDETISSRLGRCGPVWAEKAVDWLFYHLAGQRNHCKSSIGV